MNLLNDLDPDAVLGEDPLALDLTGIDERGSYEPVAPGIYDATIEAAEYTRSRRSNNPMITWQFRVTTPEGTSRLLFYHTVLVDSGLSRLKRLLVRVAPNDPELVAQFRPKTDWAKLIGLPARIRVRVRTYEGSLLNEVSDVLPGVTPELGFPQ